MRRPLKAELLFCLFRDLGIDRVVGSLHSADAEKLAVHPYKVRLADTTSRAGSKCLRQKTVMCPP